MRTGFAKLGYQQRVGSNPHGYPRGGEVVTRHVDPLDLRPPEADSVVIGGRTAADVRWLLEDQISDFHEHRWMLHYVPHGFTLSAVSVRPVGDPIVPDLKHWRADIAFQLPVVYSYRNFRACLPANRVNIEGLHSAMAGILADLRLHSELVGWHVDPEHDPPPRRDPEGEEPHWAVRAAVELR